MTQADVGVTVIGKVARILDVLADRGEVSLTRLAAESRLAKTTVYRLCEDLGRAGMIDRGGIGIKLGDNMIRYGTSAADRMPLSAETVIPVMADLYSALTPGAVVAVHVSTATADDEVLCIARLAGMRSERAELGPQQGASAPWPAVAEGWVLRAFGPPQALTTPQRHRANEVRRQGYATQRYGGRGGRTGIGVAVPMRIQQTLTALTVDIAEAGGVDFRLIREVVQQSVRASSAASAAVRELPRSGSGVDTPGAAS